jgi:hypothetical protein
MSDEHVGQIELRRREHLNKGKLSGAKPPLQPKHVWAIRTRLQIARRTRDLALFNLAIDSKLRGCDTVSIKIDDVALTATQSAALRSANGRRAGQSSSRSPNRPARRSMIFWWRHNPLRTIIFSEGSAAATI